MSRVVVEMTSDEARLHAGLQKVLAQQNKLERGFRDVGREGQRAGRRAQRAFGGPAASSMKSYLTSVLGVSAAIAAVSRHYEAWIKNMREGALETNKAANELVAFAALQEASAIPGRVAAVAGLGTRYGAKDRGAVFGLVQAMQSALTQPGMTEAQGFAAGLRVSEAILQATQLGVSVETARELATLGVAQRQDPVQFLRQAYAAGQLSAREPETIAAGAPGMLYFKDKILAFAAAATISAGIDPGQLPTFVKAAGEGLMPLPGTAFRKTLTGLGVPDTATRSEILKAVYETGAREPYELGKMGLTEKRAGTAISLMLKGYETVRRLEAEIPAKAVPGLLMSDRAKIEAALPMARAQREYDILTAGTRDLQAFGPTAPGQQRALNLEARRGRILRNIGFETFLGDLIDEEGRTSPAQWYRAKMRAMFRTPEGGIMPAGAAGAPYGGGPTWFEEQVWRENVRIDWELRGADPSTRGHPLAGLGGVTDALANVVADLRDAVNRWKTGADLTPLPEG